ncbi:MAG: helix-turn-helix transcriptional regulator [bacterium]
MNIKKIIGTNVRGYRKKLGWSQEKMGTLGNLTPEYISSVENGHENPKAERIVKLSKILKTAPGKVFEHEAFKKESSQGFFSMNVSMFPNFLAAIFF